MQRTLRIAGDVYSSFYVESEIDEIQSVSAFINDIQEMQDFKQRNFPKGTIFTYENDDNSSS